FLYDGWNVVAELNATNNAMIRSYTWGTDLSGSVQGAGGVGGLLHVGYHVGTVTNGFVAYDGNGNVAALVRASDGTTVARYDYGPFAEPLRATGPMAAANPMRFSTKYEDGESGFLYYGHRYYNPATGRWISRDPLLEDGFAAARRPSVFFNRIEDANQYQFVSNAPIGGIDYLGLTCTCGPDITIPLSTTLREVEDEFGKLDVLGKVQACAAVGGIGANLENAWDINTLAYTSPNYPAQEIGYLDPLEKGETSHCCSFYSCRETVVLGGRCVHSHQATFVLLGRIAHLCGVPTGVVHPFIDEWKRKRYPNSHEIYTQQAHALADYGNSGSFPRDFYGLDACFIKAGYETQMHSFTWTWEPFHPRHPKTQK
ncbi:MAG TPA: RHS repeat-associated core domain-containing protein, partial [Verrucomicrobiota bacterium]|nr:RHS repeat-associated core domain-containing protein [Verrucomicrobiota bacterium]